jgi:tetratricopeptide (TPR) repeat protein
MPVPPNQPDSAVAPLAPDRDSVQGLLIEAIGHHNDGRTALAEILYRRVIDSEGGHAVANYGLALLCGLQGRLPEAVEAYREAIAIRPDFTDAYINLGTTCLALGHPEDAIALYRQAIAIDPENAMAHCNLGKALQDLGRIDEAVESYQHAITCEPNAAVAHVNLGAALLERRAWDDAAAISRRAIALQPDSALAHANLGTALLHLGRRHEALAACRHAISLNPREATINASLGGAMLELGALQEAADLCGHALTLEPDMANACFNLSHAYKAMNRLVEAEAAARKAIALCPASAEYHFHLAHLLLVQGQFEAGWAEYDWRWKLPEFAWINRAHGAFSQPLWAGEDINDKTILIYTEQGLGDIILFARYLPLVASIARHVIMAVHPPMLRLLGSMEGVTIVPISDPLPAFDAHCPLLSLPRAFGTDLHNIPAAVPYLHTASADRDRWRERIGQGRFRVGIVWAGNPATKRDHFRSPGLSSVRPLLSVPGVDFIVLQMGEGRLDLDGNP